MIFHGFDAAPASDGRELDRAGVEVLTKIKRECAGMTVAEQTRSEPWNLTERGNVEGVLARGRAFVRRVSGFNVWLLYRFDDENVFVMTARGEPPVPAD